jgi:hypothetical protein
MYKILLFCTSVLDYVAFRTAFSNLYDRYTSTKEYKKPQPYFPADLCKKWTLERMPIRTSLLALALTG